MWPIGMVPVLLASTSMFGDVSTKTSALPRWERSTAPPTTSGKLQRFFDRYLTAENDNWEAEAKVDVEIRSPDDKNARRVAGDIGHWKRCNGGNGSWMRIPDH
jgi:hypothetical protein